MVKVKDLSGVIVDESEEFTLGDLCRASSRHAEWLMLMIDEGVIEPVSRQHKQWRFSGRQLRRARIASRLQRDLQVNLAGAALALQLMEEIDELRERVSVLEWRE